MPPKKASTVTNSKGKETEATAAVGRPRRAAATAAPAKAKATPVKKAAPAKKPATKATTTTTPATGKKRGRPAKASTEDEPPKKRGRPAKGGAPAVPLDEEKAPPKKRGRPPKGGETTKVDAGEDAAAEQLEEELDDVAEDGPRKTNTSPIKKRGRPAKAASKGKKAAAVSSPTDGADEDVEEDAVDGVDGVKQFWLMKAEQEDREETLKDGSVYNAKFTIDDLREKAGPEPWDGVRNPGACKNMKEMKLGDLAFFYASGGKKGKQPGIVGIMEVVKEAEPDMSAFDENAAYYVENAKMRGTADKPRWYMVHVEFRKKLAPPVTRQELQKYTESNGVLAGMQEFNAARLSVSKVSKDEWEFICDNLIEGYEDDATLANGVEGSDAMVEIDAELPNGTAIPTVKRSIESDPMTTDTLVTADAAAKSSLVASRASSKAPSENKSTSRPASRAGSKPPTEKKPASLPGSRAGSLAPPRATSRGRSRTPGGRTRAGSARPPSEMVSIQE